MLEIKLERQGKRELYKLIVGYNQELIEKIKELSSEQREFDINSKKWSLTAIGLYNLILLYKGRKDIFFKFESDKQKELFGNIIKKHKNRISNKIERFNDIQEENNFILDMKSKLPELTKNFDYTPYLKDGIVPMQHQIEGAYFANELSKLTNKSTLLAMDLGTGKSLTSILAAQMDSEVKKVLFILPANLKLNIQNEVEKFTNEKCYVIKATKKNNKIVLENYKRNKGYTIEDCKYIVLSYSYFSKSDFRKDLWIESIGLTKIDMIIFDEVHNISNKKSNRSENITLSFDNLVKKRIALSATPLKNNVSKFFPILKMLKPDEFTNESKFFIEYCGMYYDKDPDEGYPGWKQGSKNQFTQLYNKIQTFTFRVKKEDVLKDLPPLVISKILIEMTPAEAKEYKEILNGFKKIDWNNLTLKESEVLDNETPSAMVILTRLRQFTAMIKIKKAAELINDFNDNNEKVLLFDTYKDPLYALKKILGNGTEMYSGDDSTDRKQELVDIFQDKNSYLNNLLISLMAGNAGITLTESSNIIQTTQSYVPADNSQAYARAHRIGQLLQVFVYILIVVDTIDEEIYDILQEKEKIIKQIIDGEEHIDTNEVSVLKEFMNILKDRYN